MKFTKEIQHLLKKDLILEYRRKYAINGVLVYVLSTIFICYLSFGLKIKELSPITWNALFWIIMLFSAVTAAGKSFIQENPGRHIYYYTIARPESVIIAKILYNTLLLIIISVLAYLFYSLFLNNPVEDQLLFIINLILGAIAFASVLTMISGIASKAGNNGSLMAILSFPVIVPVLLLLIKISKNAIDGIDRGSSMDELLVLGAINIMVVTVSYILFPYLWRS